MFLSDYCPCIIILSLFYAHVDGVIAMFSFVCSVCVLLLPLLLCYSLFYALIGYVSK